MIVIGTISHVICVHWSMMHAAEEKRAQRIYEYSWKSAQKVAAVAVVLLRYTAVMAAVRRRPMLSVIYSSWVLCLVMCVCVCALDMLLFTRWMPLQKFRMISSCEQFRCNIRWYKRRFTTLHWRWAVEMQRTSCVYVLIIFICTNCAQSQRCG